MTVAVLIFPHQLVAEHQLYHLNAPIYLVEEHLFFRAFKFHKMKIAYHRASMKSYASRLALRSIEVRYIESTSKLSSIGRLIDHLACQGHTKIAYMNPTDEKLELHIEDALERNNLVSDEYENPLFINQRTQLLSFFTPSKKSFFQTSFYKSQRRHLNLLLDSDEKPLGGKWTYDSENRKKYPKNKRPPELPELHADAEWREAVQYTLTHYGDHPGALTDHPLYPYHPRDVTVWLERFLTERFHDFGAYEDAMVTHHRTLNHSVLTPMMNIGLISPLEVVHSAIDYADHHEVPLNSLEGFIRQIIGWREFIRGMYEHRGQVSRTTNYWGFHREIPKSFYEGTTGIDPVDHVIRSVLETGYCHHIERLMVLGNFMLLSEFHPDAVYRWFMELFIDAYDWVMVPNVYGMSQFADGGLFATKPYISGSNYLRKMSNYPKGAWQETWDGLYWRFIDRHRAFFLKNPRLSMMVRLYDKMSSERRQQHQDRAVAWLDQS